MIGIEEGGMALTENGDEHQEDCRDHAHVVGLNESFGDQI